MGCLELPVSNTAAGRENLFSFTERIATRTPILEEGAAPPAGGAASAAAAAVAAALAEMVLACSIDVSNTAGDLRVVQHEFAVSRRRLLELVEEDPRAYREVQTTRRARRAKKGDPSVEAEYLAALHRAIAAPLEIGRIATRLAITLKAAQPRTKAGVVGDMVVSLALFRAAKDGALAVVAANLDELKSAGQSTADVEADIARLQSKS
jgi:formiminotetrahydrofolate cyclodeaminase